MACESSAILASSSLAQAWRTDGGIWRRSVIGGRLVQSSLVVYAELWEEETEPLVVYAESWEEKTESLVVYAESWEEETEL
jgi:hypothetical protein